MHTETFNHFVGIGAGPSNLSLAALSQTVGGLRGQFFEREYEPVWHPGLSFPESRLQTSFLKDLVTPVDPTSRYSFLSYLVANKRLYSFLTASFSQISRAEFSAYFAWVSRRLPNLVRGCEIESVGFDGARWRLEASDRAVSARDLVIGVGRRPWVPASAKPHLSDDVFHSGDYCRRERRVGGRRVAVIGGGQSGAEIFYHLLLDGSALPSRAVWVSRRPNFLPLDDSPFANEWFTPDYVNHFFGLNPSSRTQRVAEQALASDGVTMELLQDIYRLIYQRRFVERGERQTIGLRPEHELIGMERSSGGMTLRFRGGDGQPWIEEFDTVVLATGYRWALPAALEGLRDRLHIVADEPVIRADYSMEWDGPDDRRIFVQNAARGQRGVADPNLSLLAWRSAVILNALAGRTVHDVSAPPSIVEWGPNPRAGRMLDHGSSRVAS